LADRFKDVEALLLLRERTPISAALVARLPRLKLITISGPYPNIDVAACTAHGIAVCASANRASMATPELTRGLIMAAMRHIPDEVARLKAGAWRRQIGRVLHGRRRRAHVCVAGMIPAERGHGAKVRLRPPYRFRLTPPSD
jgi:D-3-phosphoglycerate dehydrogenase